MIFGKLDYDDKIMKSIKYSFKTCREIVEDTKLDYNIVSRRLKQFRKDDIVYYQQVENYNKSGAAPMKYKLKEF